MWGKFLILGLTVGIEPGTPSERISHIDGQYRDSTIVPALASTYFRLLVTVVPTIASGY